MLISDFAVIMNLITIALLGFFVGALLLTIAWTVFGKLIGSYSIQSQKTLILTWVLGPWVLGLMTMLFFSPLFEGTAIYNWVESVVHWHHLYVFQFSSWHGVSVVLFVLFSIALIAVKGTQLYRQGNAINTLKHFSIAEDQSQGQHNVQIIDSDIPTAFTAGFFRPVCYVATGMADNLSDKELDIVVEHELAHARNRDPLTKLLIAFLSAYYPKRLAQLLNQKYALLTEHIADQSTVIGHSAEDVAATLVKVVRLNTVLPKNASNTSLSFFGGNDISQRVQQLLTPTRKSLPVIVPIAFMMVMLCFTIVAVDATHHLVESVFTHS
ncbi:M56 family metallopeptidase [Alteromonas sp. M12]|uniref:M56 family metallopeptidase n=1 Tax=Alteromonas sp. M12 TaxID=3135644 RepID=UPI00319E5541